MNILTLGIVIFIMALFILEMGLYAYRLMAYPDRKKVRKRLKGISLSEDANNDIMKKYVLSEVPLLNQILGALPGARKLNLLVRQANSSHTIGFFLLLALVLGLIGFQAARLLSGSYILSVVVCVVVAPLPFLHLRRKKRQRIEKFRKQLPEAIELIGRALRAGHAFTSGMRLAADQFEEPLGPEFDETLDEVNYGVSVPDGLRNLALRVDCPDLKYFVVSVILQQQTGGNLAEIIGNIAHIIRERFKFQGKIRVLSAEGRLSAYVLMALPLLVVLALKLTSPKYIETLWIEPAGRLAGTIALCMMFVGVFVMRRMIKIEV